MPENENVIIEMYNYLSLDLHDTIFFSKKKFIRKYGIFEILLKELQKEPIPLESIHHLASDYASKHKGKFSDYCKVIAKTDKEKLLNDLNEFRGHLEILNKDEYEGKPRPAIIIRNMHFDLFVEIKKILNIKDQPAEKYLESKRIEFLNFYTYKNDYAKAKSLLERFKNQWDPQRDESLLNDYQKERPLHSAVKRDNPQMVALLLKFNIPDCKDNENVTSEQLAKGIGGISLPVQKQGLFVAAASHAPVDRFKSPACAEAFALARTSDEIKNHPLLFIIENYFRKNIYQKKTGVKYTQFLDILDILIDSQHPQADIKKYIDDHFKKGDSRFRDSIKVLTEWNDADLKANFETYCKIVLEDQPIEALKDKINERLQFEKNSTESGLEMENTSKGVTLRRGD